MDFLLTLINRISQKSYKNELCMFNFNIMVIDEMSKWRK